MKYIIMENISALFPRLHYNEYPQQFIDEENFKKYFSKNILRWISLDENFNKVFQKLDMENLYGIFF